MAEPISSINNKPARVIKKVTVRRLPSSGKEKLRNWFSQQDWKEIFSAVSAHEKAEILQSKIMSKIDQYLPESSVCFSSDDQPWFTPELKQLDKQRKLEYRRHRRSFRWKEINRKFKQKVSSTKATFYKRRVADLKEGKPGQWYSHDQMKSEQTECGEIFHLSDQEQVEVIADRFLSVSN
jgi:hypothetical protein